MSLFVENPSSTVARAKTGSGQLPHALAVYALLRIAETVIAMINGQL